MRITFTFILLAINLSNSYALISDFKKDISIYLYISINYKTAFKGFNLNLLHLRSLDVTAQQLRIGRHAPDRINWIP